MASNSSALLEGSFELAAVGIIINLRKKARQIEWQLMEAILGNADGLRCNSRSRVCF
jgi:hypothetical protein